MSHEAAGKAPRVSVILCAYRSGERILPTIRSILGQTFQDFELLIIDDASGDDTSNIIRTIHDPRIRLIINDTNLGVAGSRNRGVDSAAAEYIAHCDHDDIWKPGKLEKQVEFMDRYPNHGLVGTEFELFLDKRSIEATSLRRRSSAYLRWLLFQQSVFLHSSTMMRQSVLKEHGLVYDATLAFADDWCIYHQIAKVSEIGVIDEVLAEYHLHDRNWSKVAKKEMQARGRRFFAGELEERVGHPVADAVVQDYLEAVVEGEGCRDAGSARAVGLLLSEVCNSFQHDLNVTEEDLREIKSGTAEKWHSILKASARRSGPGILALYGEAGMPGWQKLHLRTTVAAYVECLLKSIYRRVRIACGH